jgi:hypothetical protein
MWRKPLNNTCYMKRDPAVKPPLCDMDDNPDEVWYFSNSFWLSLIVSSSFWLTIILVVKSQFRSSFELTSATFLSDAEFNKIKLMFHLVSNLVAW